MPGDQKKKVLLDSHKEGGIWPCFEMRFGAPALGRLYCEMNAWYYVSENVLLHGMTM